jgi:hypothetical protein
MTTKIETVETLRADFMRRWFAIAISVGFATTVVNMGWVREGRMPDYGEWEQLARLLAALVATVLSWEGYLLSIQNKPLKDFPRYFLDVFLVFLYLFLLLTSKFSYFWLYLHALTFVLYMTWDFLTIAWYREKFLLGDTRQASIFEVYTGGLIGAHSIDRGPVITMWWAAYFILLCVLPFTAIPYSTFFLAVFVLAGLGGYRVDKSRWRKLPLMSPISVVVLLFADLGIAYLVQRLA